jgi:hypothetical protein
MHLRTEDLARKAKILPSTSSADLVPHRESSGHAYGTFRSEVVDALEPLVVPATNLCRSMMPTPTGRRLRGTCRFLKFLNGVYTFAAHRHPFPWQQTAFIGPG